MLAGVSPETFQVGLVVFVVWGAAVAFKAVAALRSNRPYRLSIWDGGLLRAGRSLNRLGTQIKIGIGLAMSATCVAILSKLLPPGSGTYVFLAIAAVSLISDFTLVAVTR